MQYITEIKSYQSKKRSAVTLGKFDALHKGHQKLIEKIHKYADEDTVSIVCAFDMGREALLTGPEKKERLEGQADYLISCAFTKELREMEAEAFIEQILSKQFHASHIVVGTDFRFGYGKRGNVEMLAQYAGQFGYQLDVIEKERYQGKIISSTYIRETLSEGNIKLANMLLGYHYQVSGNVEHGKQLGRRLGFPTMNLAPAPQKILPRFGVYTCRIRIDGDWYTGICNVGVKPTVTDELRVLVEAYAFGYRGDAYGKSVKVEFEEFVRPEMKFASVEELKNQLDADIQYGKKYFKEKE